MPVWEEIRHDNIIKGFNGNLDLLIPDLDIDGEPLEDNVILWVGSKRYFVSRSEATQLTFKIQSILKRRASKLQHTVDRLNGNEQL